MQDVKKYMAEGTKTLAHVAELRCFQTDLKDEKSSQAVSPRGDGDIGLCSDLTSWFHFVFLMDAKKTFDLPQGQEEL